MNLCRICHELMCHCPVCNDIADQIEPHGLTGLCLGCGQREARRLGITLIPYGEREAPPYEGKPPLPEPEETYDDSSEFAEADKGEQQ